MDVIRKTIDNDQGAPSYGRRIHKDGSKRIRGIIPSSAYLGVAVGAMGLSLLCQMTGRGKWGNFIAQWVPTLLIIGLYNKVVKVEGHDRTDRGSAAH